MPFGAVPVLYVDGKPLAQMNAINRYLIDAYGELNSTSDRTYKVCAGSTEFKGRDAWERAQADMMCEALSDVFDGLHDWFHAKDGDECKVRYFLLAVLIQPIHNRQS